MALSGLNSASIPNGSTVWAIRNHPLLKDETNDLANDNLHLNNGLPMYATSATMWETLIAPMFGISIEMIDWIPSNDTQRCVVSSGYTEITEEQRNIIRKIIKLSASDRFGLNIL